MMDKLHFASRDEAQALRDEYFLKYHSTAKGLTAAEADSRLPLPPDGAQPGEKLFKPNELDEYWATKLDFSLLGGTLCQRTMDTFDALSKSSNQIVAFSNGPR